MRIIELVAENVKAIRAVAIVPTGDVVQITGQNGAGKSSVLDAIFYALAGKKAIPSQPIRRGQESAVIRLNLGDVRVTRRFTGEETSVVVEAESGARYPSPQRMLDELLGALSFDPLAFANAEPKVQLETLRGLVPLAVDVDALEGQNARDYELRREWNRKGQSLTEQRNALFAELDPSIDTTPVDVESLTAQMASASEWNASIDRTAAARLKTQAEISAAKETITQYAEQIASLNRKMHEREMFIVEREMLLAGCEPLPERVDVAVLRDAINDATRTNAARAHQQEMREKHQQVADDAQAALVMSRNLTETMTARSAAITEAVAAAKMPIDGLGFGSGEVLYNGLPFDQASQGERIRVSFAIAMAANPAIRVALIRDGSLLDDANMGLIAEMASANDFQVFVERVSTGGKVGILIQDGVVAAIDGVPVDSIDSMAPATTAGVQ